MRPWRFAFAFSLIALAIPGFVLAEYTVALTHGTAKQRPEFGFVASNTFHLKAARNEWEPFQVLIRDDEGTTNVDVAVTNFTGPGDPIGPVELYRVHYVPVPAERISSFPPDPSKAGDWPDGLVPFVDHFAGENRGGAPFDLPAGYTMAVFGDVFVPVGQTPGTYTATVTVTANGRADWQGDLMLAVWNFEIPSEMALAGAYGFSSGTMCGWHGARGGITDCTTLTRRYFEEFARHRIGLDTWRQNSPDHTWNAGEQTFDWDWTAFDDFHAPYFDGTFYDDGFRFNTMTLPGAPGGRPGDVDPTVWEREYWRGWAEHFRDRGWDDVLFYYLPDEPRPEQYPELRDIAARLHAADEDLQPLVTEQFEPGLAGDVDIWCPDEPLFSDSLPTPPFPEVYEERRAMGEKTWWYNCISAVVWFDFANHFVDFESSYQRIWTWLTRRYDFQGLLFWHTVYLPGLGLDPWDSQYAPPFAQGDGNLIYPGTIDRIGGTTDIPVASLRMKYIRESMEDYEYFHLLDERGDGDWVDGVVRTVSPKTYQWEHDWQALLDWREKVAEKILGTLDEIAPDAPTGMAAVGEQESIHVTWTAPGDADLAGFDVWYGIYEHDEYFGGSVGADADGATITGLTPSREYRVWVRAFDEAGNRSDPSEVVTASPLAGTESMADSPVDDDANTDDDEPSEDGEHNPNGVSVESVQDADEAHACGCGRA